MSHHHRKRSRETARPAFPRTEPTPAAAERPPVAAPAPTSQQIQERAYLKWQAAGRPSGDDMRFWLEAERELRRS